MLKDALQEQAEDLLVVRKSLLDDARFFLHDNLDLVYQRLQARLNARNVGIRVGQLIPRFRITTNLLGNQLTSINEELVLVYKHANHARTGVEIAQDLRTLLHALEIGSPVKLVKLRQKVLFQRLVKLFDDFSRIVSLRRMIVTTDSVRSIRQGTPLACRFPRIRIQPLADLEQLPCNLRAANLPVTASLPPQVFEQEQLSPLAHFEPALDEELGIQSSFPLTVELLDALANLDNLVCAADIVTAFSAMKRVVELVKSVHGFLELAAQALDVGSMLGFCAPDLRRKLRLSRFQLARQLGHAAQCMFKRTN